MTLLDVEKCENAACAQHSVRQTFVIESVGSGSSSRDRTSARGFGTRTFTGKRARTIGDKEKETNAQDDVQDVHIPEVENTTASTGLGSTAYRGSPLLEPDQDSDPWDKVRPKITDRYISSAEQRELELKTRREALHARIQGQVDDLCSKCPHCGVGTRRGATPGNTVIKVLWVGIEFRFSVDVPISVCSFCGDVFTVDAFELGCFPGSPGEAANLATTPEGHEPIWFDLSLVESFEGASNRIKRFSVVVWASWLDDIHTRNRCEAYVGLPRLRKCLGDALREYGYIEQHTSDFKKLGVDTYPSGVFGQCGGCWSAGKECTIGEKHEASRPLHSGFIDGCFKMPHLRNQTKTPITQDYSLPPNHSKFAPNHSIFEFSNKEDNVLGTVDTKGCSDFEADGELGRKSEVYDITGIMGMFCRHGYCGIALNMFTGERYMYGLFMLYLLCIQRQIVVLFFWYDIGCRFKSRWPKWLNNMESSGEHVDEALRGMSFPLPPFHKYAHSAACQMANSSSGMEGAGRPPGDDWIFDLQPI